MVKVGLETKDTEYYNNTNANAFNEKKTPKENNRTFNFYPSIVIIFVT